MANELNDIIARVTAIDPAVGAELQAQVGELTRLRPNGLNFERHQPEQVALTGRSISVGDKVKFIPERGETEVESNLTWVVSDITGPKRARNADLIQRETGKTTSRALDDLVLVADFRDPIYPGLKSTGKVERGGGKPYHTVINAENYHALEMLTFTHAGSIDVIYIDPPYNTRAKDWKYNNDYVDPTDDYAHSKWLSFMERRLKLAQKLLNPYDSVLIVTIDEKEYLRLGMLLEQTFPGAQIQMVSSVINPKGASRQGAFARVDEYLYFIRLGNSEASSLELTDEWKISEDRRAKTIRWAELLRAGSNYLREDSTNQFYPVFIKNTAEGPVFVGVGEPYYGDNLSEVEAPEGSVAVWPVRRNGDEGNWQISNENLRKKIESGFAKIGRWRSENTTLYYLKRGEEKKVLDGDYLVAGRAIDGSVSVDAAESSPRFIPGTQWRIASHNAEQGGTSVIQKLLPRRSFPFPKSLYAVEDALRFFVEDKPDAVVLDFFSGSGTTAHAVMRLNKQDGGRRLSISVTNNEVSEKEQKALVKKGRRPGDLEWEALGICDYITKPRIEAAVTGYTPAGDPIKSDYKVTDEFPMSDGFDENVEFFTLTYLNQNIVELDLAFSSIAPLLWMRAGSQGRRIEQRNDSYEIADTYAVLFDVDASGAFLKAIDEEPDLRVAYIVTDDEPQFQSIGSQIPEGIETLRLYESYIRTFKINTEGA